VSHVPGSFSSLAAEGTPPFARMGNAPPPRLPPAVVAPDRVARGFPHAWPGETSFGFVSIAGRYILPSASSRWRREQHGIRSRTESTDDTENKHAHSQFAARHALHAVGVGCCFFPGIDERVTRTTKTRAVASVDR